MTEPCGQADRCQCMEPATAKDLSTTHAPARTLGQPAQANNHEPRGHMDATYAGIAQPRQARVSKSDKKPLHKKFPSILIPTSMSVHVSTPHTRPTPTPHAEGKCTVNPAPGGPCFQFRRKRVGNRRRRGPFRTTRQCHNFPSIPNQLVHARAPSPSPDPNPQGEGTHTVKTAPRGPCPCTFRIKGWVPEEDQAPEEAITWLPTTFPQSHNFPSMPTTFRQF